MQYIDNIYFESDLSQLWTLIHIKVSISVLWGVILIYKFLSPMYYVY